jgi:glycosyltransferase involved in cell wall biosynthesis
MISLIVPVMNRTDRIIPCLSTWIDQEEIDEVLIVDWSSTLPIKYDQKVKEITDHHKTKIVRVNDEKSFMSMSFSLNVGIKNASNNHIIKCDIDYKLIKPEFLKLFKIEENKNQFYCGTAPKKWDFHGFSFFNKQHALNIEGYNEKIRGWGWDDEDFYRRMEKQGLERIVIMDVDDFIYHIPHDDSLRTANYPQDQQKKHQTNRQNALIAQEGSCGCLSTYQILIDTPKYKEIIREK